MPKSSQKIGLVLHVLAVLLALAALVLLVVFAAKQAGAAYIVGVSLFGSALFALYLFKTLHFWTEWTGHHRAELMAKLHHYAIYFLVASTYTPVALILPQRGWGWSIFGVTWFLALFSIALEAKQMWNLRVRTALAYLSFACLDLVAFLPVSDFVVGPAKLWLGGGGAAYILAAFLLAYKKSGSLPFAILGSFCHFWALLRFVMFLVV